MRKFLIGKRAEVEAATYLKSHGLSLVTQNFSCKLGEIDLIMRAEPHTLVFVEVRYRHDPAFGSAIDTVTRRKQDKIRRTAATFLQANPGFQHLNCRFAVIGIDATATRSERISWIVDAFS